MQASFGEQSWSKADYSFMNLALLHAQQGAATDEVPVGAVIVDSAGVLLAQAYNCPISTHDPTAHAEIVALRSACQRIQNYRLPIGATMYVTLEPCTMCVGALIHARLTRLVFATHEPRSGMVGSQLMLPEYPCYNHLIQVQSGLMAEESSKLLRSFFKARRNKPSVEQLR